MRKYTDWRQYDLTGLPWASSAGWNFARFISRPHTASSKAHAFAGSENPWGRVDDWT